MKKKAIGSDLMRHLFSKELRRFTMLDFISFGEILFDCFTDKQVIGGAPLNVAGHMAKLGLNGKIVSAVGNDDLGMRAIKEIKELGLSVEDIRVLNDKPTGRADITLVGKNADYTFNDPCAWDNISCESGENARLLYFGTLAQRSEKSRNTLKNLLKQNYEHIFFDVNIRKNFYTPEIITDSLNAATILKMNDEEIPLILSITGIKGEGKTALEALMKTYNIKTLLITEGKKGTTIFHEGTILHEDTADVSVVDTVGAGDSLSAGFLTALMKTGDIAKALKIGSTLADFVVTQRGAIPLYNEEITNKLRREGIL